MSEEIRLRAIRPDQIAVTVDVVTFIIQEGRLHVLLIKRRNPPYQGMWAIPGGFVEVDEPLETAAARELREETGLHDIYMEQLYTYGAPLRDPRGRVVSVVYLAVIGVGADPHADDDATDAAWFAVDELPPLAFDHADILYYAVQRLRYKLEYTSIGFRLLPDEFTLSELKTVYEIILGEKLDKRNFRRKVLQAEVLDETGRYRMGEGRPARLYRYRRGATREIRARRLFP
jgi:8-oxo-dGTP diphosphatase